jgi:hypothetical protein
MCPVSFIMSIEQEKSPTLLFSWQSLSCNQQIFLLGTLLNDSLLHMDSIMISDVLNRGLYYVGICFKNTLQVFSAHLLFSSRCVLPRFSTFCMGSSMYFTICQVLERFMGFHGRYFSTVNPLNHLGNNALCRSHNMSVYLSRNGIPPPKFRGSPPRAKSQVSFLT